jgi:hypothetical protein
MEIINKDNKDQKSEYSIIRKGLIKFFDYQIKNDSKKKQKERNIIFKEIEELFKNETKTDKTENDNNFIKIEENKGIYIYSTEKANGENVQISFNLYTNSWVIASKNVTILAKDKSDLDFYRNYEPKNKIYKKDNNNTLEDKKRFTYCVEFAELWFEILEKKIKTNNLEEKLKAELCSLSIIGENVGDENHQHIKLYEEKDIQFYAIVENVGKKICLPVEECKNFMAKFGLTMVKYKKSNLLITKEEVEKEINQLYEIILNNSVEEEGEGSVIYFSKFENGKEEILQLAKLKTFEYRFYRKLREKIKNLQKNSTSDSIKETIKVTLSKIKNECESILNEEGDKYDLENLINFADFVLNKIYAKGLGYNYEDKYANFISVLKDLYDLETLNLKSLKINDNDNHINNYDNYNENFNLINEEKKIYLNKKFDDLCGKLIER